MKLTKVVQTGNWEIRQGTQPATGVEIRLLMYYFLCKFSFLNHMDVSIQNLKTKILIGLGHRLSQPQPLAMLPWLTYFFSLWMP